MKKLIAIFACIALVACLVVIPVSAEGFTVTTDPENAIVNAGETQDVDIIISDVPENVTSVAFELTLSSGLEIAQEEDEGEFYPCVTINNLAKSKKAKTIDSFDAQTNKGAFTVDKSTIVDGTLATVTVKVKDSVTDSQSLGVRVILHKGSDLSFEVEDTKTVTISVPHDHNYVNETVAEKYLKSAATCQSKAIYYKSCSICGEASETETFESGEKAAHTEGEWETTTPATCTANGEKVKKCTVCQTVLDTDVITAPGHTNGDAVKENEVAATCKSYASYDEVVYCTVCKAEVSRNHKVGTEYAEHTPGEWEVTKPNTCTEKGEKVKKCTVCSAVLDTADIDAPGHTPGEWEVTKPNTCTEKGEKVKKCTVCSAVVETADIDAPGHTPGEWEVTKPNTCTEKGTKVKKCTVCSAVVETADIDAPGHKEGEWEVAEEPTTEKEGLEVQKCTVCGVIVNQKPIDKLEKADVTEGDKGEYKGGSTGLKFKTKLTGGVATVKVNGVLVDPENYETETDSATGITTVTLKPAYLATLGNASYSVVISSATEQATAAFTVAASEGGSSPKTGMDVLFWIIVLLASSAVITGSVVYRRKVR